MKYSVLMSVYYKDNHLWLIEALNSIINQSIKPNEIVLVKDGELTEDLEKVISEYAKKNSSIIVVALEKNVGLGNALNEGLKYCKYEYVARMDSDDIAVNNRMELQLNFLENRSDISVIGGHVLEFIDSIDNVIVEKRVPLDSIAINKQMKKRNVINHPTVMFRKKDVIQLGGYKEIFLNEDYYLWIRMILNGFIMENIDETLVYMRISDETYLRRGGYKQFKAQRKVFDYMKKNKMINLFSYVKSLVSRFILAVLLPNKLRKFIYLKILRKKKGK